MAQAVGADTTALRGFYGHVLSRQALHDDKVWPYPELDHLAASGIVVNDRGGVRGVDWRFNAWGGLQGGLYFPWDRDDAVAQKIIEIEGCERYRAPFVLEGGSIHVDGQGTLITTKVTIGYDAPWRQVQSMLLIAADRNDREIWADHRARLEPRIPFIGKRAQLPGRRAHHCRCLTRSRRMPNCSPTSCGKRGIFGSRDCPGPTSSKPSPSTGEGKGGGGKDNKYCSAFLFSPPLYPLPQGEGRRVVGQARWEILNESVLCG
jgi:hypothetical protein